MDASKPGKGILASLEHAKGRQPTRIHPHRGDGLASGRGPALVIGSGVLVGALLAWWIYSGPSPIVAHEAALPVPQPAHVAAAPEAPPAAEATAAAAAIIEDAPAPSAVVAAALAPTPVATVVMRRERPAAAKPQPKEVRRDSPPRSLRTVRAPAAPDTDVALLTALVAHASGGDVVEPHLADSTASLLQRCQRVGGEEGRLCRLRICSSRADDDACRPQ
ncbi:hypothetical protein IP92_05331 [Pseudoduganella flava]|uniref:Uncharacterized protein n=1 Tax=Pseudoduganella flava TaxID=871742 RepID=A0A562PF02_9BURK|nr:hypothetical protein [Pseudoduganella flava]QGZ38921.1 hypothetical protein GO485_07570 [Pseudoduganella flava]TWI42997.1 hypothetical protein IP92_05331 [Pseudoduganella flava]